MPTRIFLHVILCACTCSPLPALAGEESPNPAEPPAAASSLAASKYPGLDSFEATLPPWFPKLLGAQATAVNQKQLPFRSLYSGQNSLNEHGQDATSFTRSLEFGSQVTERFQVYLDMDWFTGQGLHGGSGAAGFPNGEVVRAGSVNLAKKPYLARFYGQYLLPLSGETVLLERGADQLPGPAPAEYAVVKGGKLAAADDFDVNRYANSARLQFLNFALINNVAWDYAADTRGYTWGAMAGIVRATWALKLGSYAMPKVANGSHFDTQFGEDHGDNLELALRPFGNDTVIRLLAFENYGRMARYATVIAQGKAAGVAPDVATDNAPGRIKYGFGVNAEIPVADGGDTGVFLRAGWNDGKTSTFAFTDVDRQVSGGMQVSGVHWGRDNDWVGFGVAVSMLSAPHKAFFAAGGLGLLIGDGQLRTYAPEEIVEAYYNFRVVENVRASPDYQLINNPAYNADRGPVHIFSLRLRASM